MSEQAHAPPTEPPGPPSGAWWLLPLALVLTLLVHLPSLGGELVYDDMLMVAQNPMLQDWGSIGQAFQGAYWDFLDPDQASRIGYWRPLTALALTLGWSLGDGAPGAFHGLSIAIHLLATAAAFLLARRLLRSASAGFWAALLFGVHPLHVESVAWITALNDPLFGALALLSLHAFLRWRDAGSSGLPWAAALWLIPALLAKELAAAVVPLALALDLGRGRERGRLLAGPLLRGYLLFAVVGLGYYLARTQVFGSPLAGFDRVTTDFGLDPRRMLLMRFEILGGSLGLLAWPHPLTIFRPVIPDFAWSSSHALGFLAALLVWTALLVHAWRSRAGAALAGLLIVPAGLVPVLVRVESLGLFPLSDRFLYLPVLGATIWVACIGARTLTRGVNIALLGALAALCAWRSVEQSEVWQDNESLHRHAVQAEPRSPYARWTLGGVLMRKYQASEDPADLRACFDEFLASEELLLAAREGDESLFATADDFLQSNIGKGWCFLFEAMVDGFEDFDTPRRIFEYTIEARPTSAEAYAGLGTVLWQIARVTADPAEKNAARQEAEAAFKAAIELHERFAPAHLNLARLHADFGDWSRARTHFERCTELRPNDPRAWLRLAECWYEEGWVDRAREIAREAHERFPEEPVAMRLLGTFAAARDDRDQALSWFDRALALDPDDGEAIYQRARMLLSMEQGAEAIQELRRACDLLVDRFEPHYDLGAVLLGREAQDEAKRYLARAYELGVTGDDAGRQQALSALRNQLILLCKDDAELLHGFATTDRQRGQLEYASVWNQATLQADPEHGRALYLKAILQRDGQATELAKDTFRHACRVLPDDFEPHFDLGLLLAREGEAQEATHYLARALEIGLPPEWGAEQRRLVNELLEAKLEELSVVQGPPSSGDD